jgi:hypothetical protein
MKTNNDYQMFFQGYLEALTDIDGDQREFGVFVRMFNSSSSKHLLDIQKEFNYKEPINIIYSKKFRNFYSLSYILKKLIFVKFFNGAKVPKKSLKSFRDYVVFHIVDYIDFSFDDAAYVLGSKKSFEILVKRGENINTIFLVISTRSKKLIFRFYHNKKYISDEVFDKWVENMIKKEEENHIAQVKKQGIREHKINSFRYKEYDRDEILESAYEIFVCSNIQSKSIEKICTKEDWKLKKLIPLYEKGLDEIYGKELKPIEEIAHWKVISNIFKVGYKEEFKFKKRLKHMLNAVKEYNQKFQTKESIKKYKLNNKYGYSISPELHDFLIYFEHIIHMNKNDKAITKVLKKKYQKESMQELWKEIFSQLKQIKVTKS